MADQIIKFGALAPGHLPLRFKDVNGDGSVYAPVMALDAGSVGGGGGLTDAQLRATAVPVSGTFWQATQPVSGTFWQATQPISVASLPLPTGAATEATAANIYTRLADGTQRIEAGGATGAAIPARAIQMGGSDGTLLRALSVDTAGRQNVNVNGTVPVSGTFWQATQPVSIATLPALATGTNSIGTVRINRADNANFLDTTEGSTFADSRPGFVVFARAAGAGAGAVTKPFIVDGSGNLQVAVQGTVPVSGTFWQATQPVSGTFWQATQPVSIASMPSTPVTGTFWQATQPVSAVALPLPAGAATDATVVASLGSSTATDSPYAWTVLDQLNRIRKLETQNVQLLTQLVALQTPKPAPKVQPTLLHRS